MSFAEIQSKIIARWWIILAVIIVFSLGFYPWARSKSFQASIGLGISFNSPTFTNGSDPSTRSAYAESLTEFAKYLTARFSSVEIQDKIADRVGIVISDYSDKKPFYNVVLQSGGFVSINATFPAQATAQRFNQEVKNVYQELVTIERNQNELAAFKIKPMTQFQETVTEVSRPTQMQVLPSIIGLLVGLAIVIIIPKRAI